MCVLPDFPWDIVFTAPPALGFIVMLSKSTNSVANMLSAFDKPRAGKFASGDCERFSGGDIQVVSGCTKAVSVPGSSPLTRHRI